MARVRTIPHRNLSPTGWWLFREVEHWVSHRQKKLRPGSRCRVWDNLRLIKAKDRDEAFAKAMRLGREGHPSKTLGGEWRFAGIADLLPVHEPIEDGAEILWHDRGVVSMRRLKTLVKSKKRLSVFDDSPENQ